MTIGELLARLDHGAGCIERRGPAAEAGRQCVGSNPDEDVAIPCQLRAARAVSKDLEPKPSPHDTSGNTDGVFSSPVTRSAAIRPRFASSSSSARLPIFAARYARSPLAPQPSGAGEDEDWELGPDVLVAPVVTFGATLRTVRLPTGCWTAQPTGRRYGGGRTVTVDAPLGSLPYFFRCGTTPF